MLFPPQGRRVTVQINAAIVAEMRCILCADRAIIMGDCGAIKPIFVRSFGLFAMVLSAVRRSLSALRVYVHKGR